MIAWAMRLSREPTATLPRRVRRAIRERQDESEILTSWVQMGVVVAFGTLYALAPKTFGPDAPFEPVPWALAAYGLFTLFRLFLAYRRALPAWLLAVSVTIDMTLLLGLIWSFHLQYQQPPAFYLKAPTLLYLFIFIALRTLRFEAGYVVLAGGMAAVGWLVLVLYAAAFDAEGMPTTRNYVAYMTSAKILWGAEFDKIASILVVTLVLSMALVRARQTLVEAVAESSAAADLRRFFAPDVAQLITDADERASPGQAVIREAGTLFVDIRGFTALTGKLPPDALTQLLSEYQARLVPVIQRHGGSIDKFLGDGIMASFGATRTSQTYAADALRAVDDVLDEAAAWQSARETAGLAAPRIGAAVAVGPVLFGAVGDRTRLEYTVIGEAVNLAAKLEKHTKLVGVRALTTAQAESLARAQGYVPRGQHLRRPAEHVDGLGNRLDLVVLG